MAHAVPWQANPVRVVRAPERLTLKVTVPVGDRGNERTYVVEGRTAKLIHWLLFQRWRIEALPVAKLTFHLGHDRIKPELVEGFDPIPAAPEKLDSVGETVA